MRQTILAKGFRLLEHFGKRRSVMVLISFGLLVWLAHFFCYRDFGLYEDDYGFIPDAMHRSFSYPLERLQNFIWWKEGRPVGFFLIALFAFVGDKLGGVSTMYCIGFLIVTLNAYLFYRILRKVESENVALIGGIIFCLFPADTTRILLTHSLILQPSLTFLMLATLLYLSDRSVAAYGMILGSFLSYESVFMVFFGIPLLKPKWNLGLLKELVKHTVILLCLMSCMTVIRVCLGESRTQDLQTISEFIPQRIFTSLFIGPNTSLSQFIWAPLRMVSQLNLTNLAVMMLCLVVFYLSLTRLLNHPYGGFEESLDLKAIELVQPSLPVFVRQQNANKILKVEGFYLNSLKLLVTGLVFVCLSYLLCFTVPTFPPTHAYGRLTSVHVAAAFGGSIFLASLINLSLFMMQANRYGSYGLIFLSMYLTSLVGYHIVVQMDFVRSWQYQRELWTEVLSKSPDIDSKTMVALVDQNLPTTQFIQTMAWSDILVLKQICGYLTTDRLPWMVLKDNWASSPILFRVPADWRDHIYAQNGELVMPQTSFSLWKSINVVPESTIVLEKVGDHLVRLQQAISKDGHHFQLKPIQSKQRSPSEQLTCTKGVLFPYLIDQAKL